MKIGKMVAIGLIVLLAVLFWAYQNNFWKKENTEQANLAKSATQQQNLSTPIKAHVVTSETLEDKITSVGSVVANEEVQLICETAGKIQRIYFEEGSLVMKGQLLVELNDADLQAQVRKAQIRKELLEKKRERDLKLYAKKGVSEEEMEALQADLDGTKAEIEVIKAQIDKTKLKAPFGGKVGLRYVSEGSFTNTNTKVADLIDYSRIKVDFSIPEKYMNAVAKGTKISFTVAGQDRIYTGTVFAVEPKIEASTRSIKIRAIAENTDNKILPGAFANIQIILNQIPNARLIPSQAIIPEMDKKVVFLVKNGKAERVEIRTGIRTENKVQVLEGLNLGDTVITSGILQISKGSKVNISEME